MRLNLRKTLPSSHVHPTNRSTTTTINAPMKFLNKILSSHLLKKDSEQNLRPGQSACIDKTPHHPLRGEEVFYVGSNKQSPHYNPSDNEIPVHARRSSRRLMMSVKRMEERLSLATSNTLLPYPGRQSATPEQALYHDLHRSLAYVRAKVLRMIEADRCLREFVLPNANNPSAPL